MFEDVTSRYDMSDATIEIIVMLLVAFLLGALLGYWLKRCEQEGVQQLVNAEEEGAPSGSMLQEEMDTSEVKISEDWKPVVMSSPDGQADDLKRISGIGPVIERTLNELGIFHYKQIAELSSENTAWLDNYIAFPGRIDRENWVGQAKDLLAGVETDFSNRYDKG